MWFHRIQWLHGSVVVGSSPSIVSVKTFTIFKQHWSLPNTHGSKKMQEYSHQEILEPVLIETQALSMERSDVINKLLVKIKFVVIVLVK